MFKTLLAIVLCQTALYDPNISDHKSAILNFSKKPGGIEEEIIYPVPRRIGGNHDIYPDVKEENVKIQKLNG